MNIRNQCNMNKLTLKLATPKIPRQVAAPATSVKVLRRAIFLDEVWKTFICLYRMMTIIDTAQWDGIKGCGIRCVIVQCVKSQMTAGGVA